jgi:hypothetical protein
MLLARQLLPLFLQALLLGMLPGVPVWQRG